MCDLKGLLDSLSVSKNLAQVFCIDHSQRTERRFIVEEYGFTYIHRPENPGYGAGHNVGIRRSIKDGALSND